MGKKNGKGLPQLWIPCIPAMATLGTMDPNLKTCLKVRVNTPDNVENYKAVFRQMRPIKGIMKEGHFLSDN